MRKKAVPNHTHQDVDDISSNDELLRYAAAGRLHSLLGQGLSQERIAVGAGLGALPRNAGPVLATALKKGFTQRQLSGLDDVVSALAPDLDRAGRLSSLALRLSVERPAGARDDPAAKVREAVLTAHVPGSWSRRMPSGLPGTEVDVLLRSSGLIGDFITAGRMEQPGGVSPLRELRGRCRAEVAELARQLALISVGPPTWRNYDAQTLLGLLCYFAFDQVKEPLERRLRYSTLGFRLWRAIAMVVKLSDNDPHTEVRDWVRELLRDSAELRKGSVHAGSGYDLELALAVPPAWSPPGDDWVAETLRARARDGEATLRERGAAALGLWQRALATDQPDNGAVERELRDLVTEFRDPATRPDAAAGLSWIADTLEHVMETKEAVCNTWPVVDAPWYRNVQQAAAELSRTGTGLPEHLQTGTRNLFLHMILQNSCAYRRHAIETVVTSGMNRPVARALTSLLRAERQEPWLRIRVQAALGFMQRNDVAAQTDLTLACIGAYENLNVGADEDGTPQRSRITELHAALFAVGDCFGSATGSAAGREARDLLAPVLTKLLDDTERAAKLRRPARAAAYLLGVTAQPRVNGAKDLSEELLERLRAHPDPVTSKLSSWILSFRFAEDGGIRPMLAAAVHGEPDDVPYWRKPPV